MANGDNLKQHLDNLLQETGNVKDFRTTIDTILRVHKNIQRNPGNDSYRRLNYALNDDLHQMWQFQSVRLFLYDLGWIHDEEFLFFKTLKNVEVALEVLQDFRFTINFANEQNERTVNRKIEKTTCKKNKDGYHTRNKKHKTLKEKAESANKKYQYWIDKTYFVPISASENKFKNKLKSHQAGRRILSGHPIVAPIPIRANATMPIHNAHPWSVVSLSDRLPINMAHAHVSAPSAISCASNNSRQSCSTTAVTIVTGLCSSAVSTVSKLENCFKKINLIPVNPLSSGIKSGKPSAMEFMSDLCSSALVNMVSEFDKSAESIMLVSPVSRTQPSVKPKEASTVNITRDLYAAAVNVAYRVKQYTQNLVAKLAAILRSVVTKSIDRLDSWHS